ncbi:xanthine dehydrogenase family protein molybdopterin-binding subunit [Comamonas flocculans]|uniref:Xanthine dehydrogenase family protein molybdopterin-binding subunit n=1 Tax=Comamonas flocculans TaxID=2597701 RepID=A0A5B8S0Y7_9BURK|nr:xanthine dehydrogenase family protein molybdopterin-binding subunit [Comamonas flocculans]QEA14117.1 xanthine dehydrogenase family protein molybdopterin-binding subunit [Comamonas flocculans]
MTEASDSVATRFGSGRAVQRMEDAALLKGRGRYVQNLCEPGDAWAVFVRSPHAHARIRSVDLSAARAMPGVVAVYGGADLQAAGVPAMKAGVGFRRADGSACAAPARQLLAAERVHYVGEAVALVLADSLQQAQDAAEAVQVDYEALPCVPSLAAALAREALVTPEAPDNIACEARHGDAAATAAAFARAAHVVQLTLVHQRVVALTLEPRSVRALWDAHGGRLLMQISSQMPTSVRKNVALALGLAPEAVRVQVGDVGGGFGMKVGSYPEEAALAWAARASGRPLRWMGERSEEFLSTTHGRDVQSHAALALDDEGRILALRVHSDANVGAFPTATNTAIQLLVGPWVQTSVYDIPLIDFHFRAVLTHQAPTGAYRGAGRPEAIFNIERLMDEAARQIGMDRVALRRRNFIRPEQMPYTNPMGQVYDVGRFEHVLDQALRLADAQGFAARAEASGQRGLWRGLGLATFLEWTGGNAFEERVTLQVQADGVIEVFSAVNQMGQGIATSLAQLVVDVFGVPLSRVRVVLGDTDRGNGYGSAGSRSLFTGGSAMATGAQETLRRARRLAASELEVAEPDIRYAQGRFTVAGTDRSIGLFDLAARQPEGHIHVEHTHTVAGPTWPNGAHLCEVEIDPQTGVVRLVAYAGVNDIGRVVNPLIVRGQLVGGAVQGAGQALMERVVYDDASGQLLTGSLMDYCAPRAQDFACEFRMDMDESTPCSNNLLGVKGVGELGTIGAAPCVVNAVADALARAGRGDAAPRLQMPVTAARLWSLLHG